MSEDKEKGIWQGKDGRWYAEISYQGSRWKHKGSPNKSTVQVWLSRKKQMIAKRIAEVDAEYAEASGALCDYIRLDTNSGPISASCYRIHSKRKDGSTRERWCVEVRYKGQMIRRSSPDLRTCERFREEMIARINSIITAANERRDQIRAQLARIGAEEYAQVLSLFQETKAECLASAQPTLFDSTYIMLDPMTGWYKIGKSKNVRRRLSTYCVPQFEIVLVADGDLENEVHKAYKNKRLRGEWFKLEDKDLEHLQRLYGFRKVSVG